MEKNNEDEEVNQILKIFFSNYQNKGYNQLEELLIREMIQLNVSGIFY